MDMEEQRMQGETMRQYFQRMFGDEAKPDTSAIHRDELHAEVAKKILRAQAAELVKDGSADSTIRLENEPWTLTVVFRPEGTLSRSARLTLEKMRHNAHRSVLNEGIAPNTGMLAVTFYVYTFGA